jgi:PAS domain S-box-containing protein
MKVHEIAKVTLQNEMDLILTHRRTMRLAEVAGLSLSAQTTFATAVSEVARNTIDNGKNGCLILAISSGDREKHIVARILDERQVDGNNEGLKYARRLVNNVIIEPWKEGTSVELYFYIPYSNKLETSRIDEWRNILRNEPSISAYEEIKRKNEQLQEMAYRLQQSEKRYKSLTNALPIIIFSLDSDGNLIYANEWLEQLTGKNLSELNRSKWKGVIHPDEYESFQKLINAEYNDVENNLKAECRIKSRSGNYYWHLASLSSQADDEGKSRHWIGYLVDINAQKLVEDTLRNNRELIETQRQLHEHQSALEANIYQLNRSNLELQQFAYIASHDLQEPARKIGYYSDYIINKYANLLDTKGLDYLHSMNNSALRMRTLINDLLSFARVDRDRILFNKVDLRRVCDDVIQDLEVMIAEKKADISLQELPEIDADEIMMRQLLENLMSNALKYTRENVTPVVKVRGQRQNGSIMISVADNGIGFDEKYLPQMFTLFKRLESNSNMDGTGLGLAICQKIVALHGGSITAESKPGQGSTFYVSLPVKQ